MKVMGDDGDIEVPVHLHSPVEDHYYRAWRCDYEIRFPRHVRRFHAFGEDAFQALQLVMLAIGAELSTNYYHYAGLLFWLDDDPGYGFPT